MNLDGKVAIVTGAGSGIGAATARRLTAEGVAVIAADVDAQRGHEGMEELTQPSEQTIFHCCDISRGDSWTALVGLALAKLGRLDIVHNNAFAVTVKPTHELTEEEWHRQLDVSLTAIFLSVRAAIGELCKRRGVASDEASYIN